MGVEWDWTMHALSPCLGHQLRMAVWVALVLSALWPEHDCTGRLVASASKRQGAACSCGVAGMVLRMRATVKCRPGHSVPAALFGA